MNKQHISLHLTIVQFIKKTRDYNGPMIDVVIFDNRPSW